MLTAVTVALACGGGEPAASPSEPSESPTLDRAPDPSPAPAEGRDEEVAEPGPLDPVELEPDGPGPWQPPELRVRGADAPTATVQYSVEYETLNEHDQEPHRWELSPDLAEETVHRCETDGRRLVVSSIWDDLVMFSLVVDAPEDTHDTRFDGTLRWGSSVTQRRFLRNAFEDGARLPVRVELRGRQHISGRVTGPVDVIDVENLHLERGRLELTLQGCRRVAVLAHELPPAPDLPAAPSEPATVGALVSSGAVVGEVVAAPTTSGTVEAVERETSIVQGDYQLRATPMGGTIEVDYQRRWVRFGQSRTALVRPGLVTVLEVRGLSPGREYVPVGDGWRASRVVHHAQHDFETQVREPGCYAIAVGAEILIQPFRVGDEPVRVRRQANRLWVGEQTSELAASFVSRTRLQGGVGVVTYASCP